MKISKRLKECARFVNPYTFVADVGTDHALLPIYLIKEGIAKHVIASDVRQGPLSFAKRNVEAEGLDNISIVLSDGIKHITDDVEVVIISGMGGKLISDILQDDLKNVQRLVLQPNMASDILRNSLQEMSFQIIDEVIIKDNDIHYEILVADKGTMNLTEEELMFGPVNLKNKSSEFIEYWTIEKEKLENILKNIPVTHENHEKIKNQIEMIGEVL